jgi:hypothetical protein
VAGDHEPQHVLPGTETLPEHEMRVTFLGSSGDPLPESITFPTPRLPREDQQEQFVRDLEIDPSPYYPPDVYRAPTQTWPGVTITPREMLAQRGISVGPDWRKP